MRSSLVRWFGPGLVLLLTLGLAQHRPSGQTILVPPAAGVLVQAVEAGSAAAAAGILAGDVVLGWRIAEGGPQTVFPDPWSYEQFTVDTAPRAAIVLRVQREGVARDIALPARTSRVGLTVLPLSDAAQGSAAWRRILSADRLVTQRAFDAAAREYQEVLSSVRGSTDAWRAALVQGRISALAQRQSRWDDALASLAAAMASEPRDARTLMRASWLLRQAGVLRARGSYDEAISAARESLAIRRELAGGSWDEADALNELGTIHLARRNLDQAWEMYSAARQLAADSEAAAFQRSRSDYNLALVEFRRGRLADAESLLRLALQTSARVAPESVEHARTLGLLGGILSQNGQLLEAETNMRQSLERHQRLDPGGVEEASATNNLGILAMQRGQFAESERFYRRSLALKEQLRLPPMDRAGTIGNLGLMSIERHDLTSARSYLQQFLDLVQQVAPESPEAANAFNNLARVERLANNVSDAERLARTGLAIRTKIAPNSVLQAFSFSELGKIFEAANRLDEAEAAHRQALAIRQQLLPDGTSAADSLDALGRLAQRLGRLDEAADFHARAGAIWQRMTPGGVYEAINLVERGRVETARGRSEEALGLYARATEIFDGATGSVGGSFDTQADFRSALATYYAEHVALLVARGRHAEAFHVSERARARAFMALLAQRDFTFASDLPQSLDTRRRALTREYERAQSELSSLSPTRDAQRIEERSRRLREVRLELAATNAEIVRSAPRLAGVHAALPIQVDAAQRLLDDDTAVVSYVVGTRASYGFVLTRSSLDVFPIALGRQAIDERVLRFQRLVEQRDDRNDALRALSRQLYQALLLPADVTISRRRRLLVVPDGALHALPFAALTRDRVTRSNGRDWEYLVEWRPVHQVPSLTVYAQLQSKRTRTGQRDDVLAVGDPRYAATSASNRTALSALPGTRREIELLGGLYRGQATILLDRDASEEQLRRRIADADIVHIAVHGLVNERFPLDSALAFSTPGTADEGDNGLLQAWEIIDQVRLRARLAVLSACDTAGTGEGTGEGLLGLTRAFHVAGAASVVASLWHVPDEHTPTLMRDFHRHVRDGVSVDEALARAQRTMLRDARTAHPYIWAAFVLSGRN